MTDEFRRRGVNVLGLSLEDRDVESAGLMAPKVDGTLPFELAADIDNRTLPRLQPTAVYLLGATGRIEQVFPMETYSRANWWAVLNEVDRLLGKQ